MKPDASEILKKKILCILAPLFSIALFVAAVVMLCHTLKDFQYQDLIKQLENMPKTTLIMAIFFTFLNYLSLTMCDYLAITYIANPLKYSRIALTSFIGNTFSINSGFSMILGSSLRYRLYSSWGLSAKEIAKVVGFLLATGTVGFLNIAGLMFIIEPVTLPSFLHSPVSSVQPIGIIFLVLVSIYLAASIIQKKPFKFFKWNLSMPSFKTCLAQVCISSFDWMLAGSAFYVLLPQTARLPYPTFLSIFLLSQIIGLISQVPGGLGVFETAMILLLRPVAPASSIVGALLVFRGIYYILPLTIASGLLGTHEISGKLKQKKQ